MKLFVWDFHGVLEKNNDPAVMEISNQILADFGYTERFTVEDCTRMSGQRWYTYFENLLPHESLERYYELQEACIAWPHGFAAIRKHIQPNDNAHDVLATVGSQHQQVLLSNTRPQALVEFMDAIGITKFFRSDHILAVDAHQREAQYDKLSLIRQWLDDKTFEKIIVIGDSPGDMAAAKSVGAISYLYAHPHLNFRECEADYKIRDLREVLREV